MSQLRNHLHQAGAFTCKITTQEPSIKVPVGNTTLSHYIFEAEKVTFARIAAVTCSSQPGKADNEGRAYRRREDMWSLSASRNGIREQETPAGELYRQLYTANKYDCDITGNMDSHTT